MEALEQFQKEFLQNAAFRMDESLRMIEICFDKLSEELIWKRPNDSSNSIGNLILHLCGNITQYAISSLGNQPDNRFRDEEFAKKGGYTKDELLSKITQTVGQAKATFRTTPTSEYVRVRTVQGFDFSGIGAVVHVVEHLSYHTGQIALLTKLFLDSDLGFYDGMDLNAKNEKNK